jgi:hypothetical protein
MKSTEVHEALVGLVDAVSKKGDVFTVRRGFFYTHGMTSEKLWHAIQRRFPNAVLVEHTDQWKSFRGGADLRNSSHFCVKFTLAQVVSAGEHLRGGV